MITDYMDTCLRLAGHQKPGLAYNIQIHGNANTDWAISTRELIFSAQLIICLFGSLLQLFDKVSKRGRRCPVSVREGKIINNKKSKSFGSFFWSRALLMVGRRHLYRATCKPVLVSELFQVSTSPPSSDHTSLFGWTELCKCAARWRRTHSLPHQCALDRDAQRPRSGPG
jgi:hypothetical protein